MSVAKSGKTKTQNFHTETMISLKTFKKVTFLLELKTGEDKSWIPRPGPGNMERKKR